MGHIDLHIHSIFSADGELTPEQLADRFFAAGISVAALADHNSVRGVPRFCSAARERGIRPIAATELDCMLGTQSLHLLGYGIDPDFPAFAENEAALRGKELVASQARLAAVRALGIRISSEAIAALCPDGIYPGEALADAALADRQNDVCPLLAPYRPGGVRDDNPLVNFYWDYCAQGKPAHIPVDFMTAERAVALIRDAGGIPVIAHPAITVGRDRDAISYLASLGTRGIEVFSSYHKPDDRAWFGALAAQLGLLATAGSDFHGRTKPAVFPGGTGASPADEAALLEGLKMELPGCFS